VRKRKDWLLLCCLSDKEMGRLGGKTSGGLAFEHAAIDVRVVMLNPEVPFALRLSLASAACDCDCRVENYCSSLQFGIGILSFILLLRLSLLSTAIVHLELPYFSSLALLLTIPNDPISLPSFLPFISSYSLSPSLSPSLLTHPVIITIVKILIAGSKNTVLYSSASSLLSQS